MTFWTMDESDGIPAVTLCDDHALEATNVACTLFNMGPWASMGDAALELEAMSAVFGGEGFDFKSHEIGVCGDCEAIAADLGMESA